MILTAHQPVYLPWLGLLHKIALADTFVSFNQVQYLPKDWNNRNKIRSADGWHWLTVPVLKSGYRDKTISQIKINNDTRWAIKHWRSINELYKKSRFYKSYSDFFEDLYLNHDWEYLIDLNQYILKWLLETLSIKINFIDAKTLSLQGSKSELVLNMCKELNAKTYIFGIHGKEYADINSFNKKKINIFFQEYKHPKYNQRFSDFIPNLSVIDLLFNHGPNSKDILMEGNITKVV